MDKEGDRRYELANHLGNVLAVISDRKTGIGNGVNYISFDAITISATDYFPFGMSMPGRSFTAANTEGYRYSFNGQEKDEEIGSGIYTAMFWEYDARIGRRWNMDPVWKKYPHESPYSAFMNNPIARADPNGDDPITGIIEAANSFFFNVGMQIGTNVLVKGQSFEEASKNVDYIDASLDAAQTYAMSFFISGLGTSTKLAKIAKSDVGQVVIKTVELATRQLIDDYRAGQFDDGNGDFNSDKLFDSEYLMGVLKESFISAAKDQITGKVFKSSKESGNSHVTAGGEHGEWKGPADYSKVPNPKKGVKDGGRYTSKKHRDAIFEANKTHNGGVLRSDHDGTVLVPSKKSMRGEKKPPTNEAQIDHKRSRHTGGQNSSQNAQVLGRKQNRDKGV